MSSSPGSVGLARAHPLAKAQAMEPSRQTRSSYGPPYTLGRLSSDHTRTVYSSTIATSKAAASTPDKLCPHTASAMTRQLWLRQALSAPNAELQVRENRKNIKSATQNFESLPKSQYIGLQTQRIPLHERPLLLRLQPQRLELFVQHGRRVMEHARHRLPGALRLLQSFPGCFTKNSSPLAARLIAEMLHMCYSPWFSNCWKTLRSSPVISSLSSASTLSLIHI